MGKGSHSRHCKRVWVDELKSMRDSEHVSVDQTNLDPLSGSAKSQIYDMLKNYAPVPPDKTKHTAPPVPHQPPPLPLDSNATGALSGPGVDIYNGPDCIAVIGPKKPKAEYILNRVALAAGRNPAQILHLEYKDSKGYAKGYSKSDLNYDIKCGYLRMSILATPGLSDGDK